MIADPVDRRALGLFLSLLLLVALCDLLSVYMRIKSLQDTEWPTDLYALSFVDRHPQVGVVGSSRAHYALSPSALSSCLSLESGQVIAANRMRASAYTIDIAARDFFSANDAPGILIAEVAPESLSKNHFELDFSVASNAEIQDIPECVVAAATTNAKNLSFASCSRPLFRGVENMAFLLHREWTDHRHIEWMALYQGGGQYCFGDPECQRRNADYDSRNMERWESRIKEVLPTVAPVRFADYEVGGLPATHFVAMLDRARKHQQKIWIINLPVHALYQQKIPPSAYQSFLEWTRRTVLEHGGKFLDYNLPEWQQDRTLFLDPDHLNSRGAQKMAEAVCREVAPALH